MNNEIGIDYGFDDGICISATFQNKQNKIKEKPWN